MENCASVFFMWHNFCIVFSINRLKTTVISLKTYFYCLYLFILNFIYKKIDQSFENYYKSFIIVIILLMRYLWTKWILSYLFDMQHLYELQHYVNSVANLLRKISVRQAQCFDNFNLLKDSSNVYALTDFVFFHNLPSTPTCHRIFLKAKLFYNKVRSVRPYVRNG